MQKTTWLWTPGKDGSVSQLWEISRQQSAEDYVDSSLQALATVCIWLDVSLKKGTV
jgi:hypothetical protein